jgi:hypothetical protein
LIIGSLLHTANAARRHGANVTLLTLLAAMTAACTVSTDGEPDELGALLELLPGEYAGTADMRNGGPERVVHKIAAIDLPQFGRHVLYYQLGQDSETALQQKVFVFDRGAAGQSVRMRAYYAAPGKMPANFAQRPADWASLDPAELMAFPESCAFRWRADGAGFTGVVTRETCQYDSPGFGQLVQPEMQYRVTDQTFEWTETLFGADGTPLATTGGTLCAYRR